MTMSRMKKPGTRSASRAKPATLAAPAENVSPAAIAQPASRARGKGSANNDLAAIEAIKPLVQAHGVDQVKRMVELWK
jgi:hypothetical protein